MRQTDPFITRAYLLCATLLFAAPLACGGGDEDTSTDTTANNTASMTSGDTTGETTPPVAPTEAPTIRITSPDNGAIVTGEAVTVTAQIEGGAPTLVTLTAGDQTREESGTFEDGDAVSFEIAAPTQFTEVVVTAQDDEGRQRSDRISLRPAAAPEGPQLVLISPGESASVFTETVAVEVLVLADAAPNVAVAAGDEAPLTIEVAESSEGQWRGGLEVPVAVGQTELTITATTEDEVTAETRITVTREADTTAPTIDSLLPGDGREVQRRDVTVRGVVVDEGGLDTVRVALGDAAPVDAEIDAEGGFAARITDLAVGANDLVLTATDEAGNTATEEFSLVFGARQGAGGAHSGLITDTGLLMWGRNNKGQLGLGYTSSIGDTNPDHPIAPALVQAPSMTGVASLALNQNATLALTTSGTVWAWGDGDAGQLGLGDPATPEVEEDDVLIPTQIKGITDAVAITRGYDHSMVLKADGTVLAFGDNRYGQLGDGTTDDSDIAVQVSGLTDVIQIAAGSKTSYALDAQGRVWGWGRDKYANLGRGAESDMPQTTPVQIMGLPPIEAIATGRDHVLALTSEGRVWAWGLNTSKQVGDEMLGKPVLQPVELDWLDDGVDVFANGNQSFVLRADGKLYGWGQNLLGTLGVAEEDDLTSPTAAVFGLEDVVGVAIGALHGIARVRSGETFAWGWSFQGSLGGGEGTIDRWTYKVPILVDSPSE